MAFRQVFRFTTEVAYKLRAIAEHENKSMAAVLSNLILEDHRTTFKYINVTPEEADQAYDWGYRSKSERVHNQVRYSKQFRLSEEVVTKLNRLSRMRKESKAQICEENINHEYGRLVDTGVSETLLTYT